jgi:hypothetical protein
VKCGTDTTTSHWIICEDKPGTIICKSCHNKDRYEKKKAASAKKQ